MNHFHRLALFALAPAFAIAAAFAIPERATLYGGVIGGLATGLAALASGAVALRTESSKKIARAAALGGGGGTALGIVLCLADAIAA